MAGEPITKEDIKETFKEFRKEVKKDIHEAIDERVPKIIDERLDARLPLILGQFTEEVLLPSFTTMLDESLAKHRHELKTYLDEKVADIRGEIVLLRKGFLLLIDALGRHRVLPAHELQHIVRMVHPAQDRT